MTVEASAPLAPVDVEDATRFPGVDKSDLELADRDAVSPVASPHRSEGDDERRPPVNVLLVSLAALLATLAAGFVVASVFRGGVPYVFAGAGSIIGAGGVAASYRTSRPAVVQWLTLPSAMVVAAALIASDATGGSANLPGLVLEALQQGGLSQPPVPFSPGWKFLVVVTTALLGASSASIAAAQDRPRLAVFLPVPVIFAALVVQPAEGNLSATLVALGLVVAALAVSFGAEMGRDQTTTGQFEFRRFARATSTLAGIIIVLLALTRVGFLFPETDPSSIVPPKRPDPPPAQEDRELFVVEAERVLPLRVGVLDGYDGEAFLLPPFDADRLVELDAGTGLIPEPVVARGDRDVVKVTVTISEIGGHILPGVANPIAVGHDGFTIQYDPRTQVLTLPDRRAKAGMTYEVEAVLPPDAKALNDAPGPPPALAAFLDAPPIPFTVSDLLAAAPAGGSFTRLQHLRNTLYAQVVASGEGEVTEVSPERVVELLQGGEGSPYEITAAEVLLARWAGVPARMGFGYYDGDEQEPGVWSYRPRHGRAWLEAYFEGYGWVPIVGTPAKATPSLSSGDKTENPTVKPSDDVVVPVFVPVKLESFQLFFVLARYWLGRILPVAVLVGLVVWLYPAAVRIARGVRRRRWAARRGPAARVAVAYSELRDGAFDFGVGEPRLTPLQFLDRVDADPEHRELAWLVTRALWGDLRRDLRDDDARLAEDMAVSVLRRMRSAQTVPARVLAAACRRSLADPFSDEVPNLWWRIPPRRRIGEAVRSLGRRIRRISVSPLLWRRRRIALGVVLAACLAVLGGCAETVDLSASSNAEAVDARLPAAVDGYELRREEEASAVFASASSNSLVDDGEVYSVLDRGDVEASIQLVSFKEGARARKREVRMGVLESIGKGKFELGEIGTEQVYTLELVNQRMLLWFPADGSMYLLAVTKPDFGDADAVFRELVGAVQGTTVTLPDPPGDPKRGFDG